VSLWSTLVKHGQERSSHDTFLHCVVTFFGSHRLFGCELAVLLRVVQNIICRRVLYPWIWV
jgi:hypothetical protein